MRSPLPGATLAGYDKYKGVAMRRILMAGVLTLVASFGALAQGTPLFWTVQDDQAFGSRQTLKGPNGQTIALPGRSLVALAEAKRRIGEQYGLQPVLVLTSQPGINAFATEINGQSIVAVNIDTILAIKDDADMWAALMGHEFGHVYHQHVANHQARAALINLAAQVLDTYQQRHGRQRTELIKFGAQLIDNAFTREQEREADASSVTFMSRAGYNPQGAIRLQQLLMTNYGSTGALAFLQSHPSGEERISNLQAKIAETPRPATDEAISAVEFKRYLTICGGEVKDAGIENSKVFDAQYACLKQQSTEIAKRFVLCVSDLSVDKRLNLNTLESCVAKTEPTVTRFGYVTWANYCGVDSRVDGGREAAITAKYNKCLWSNAAPLAMRGYLCEAESEHMRVLPENKAATVRACSSESTDLKTRFDVALWSIACKRKSTTTIESVADREKVERSCVAEGPALVVKAPGANKSALTAQQILAEVKAAWAKLPPTAGTPTECDKLASTIPVGDLKQHYVGYIDTVAAEPVCLSAAKSAKDNGRAMTSLAAIYLQQGKYKDAADWAAKAKAKNALNAGTVQALLLFRGLGGLNVDYAKSFALLVQEAKRGSADAIVDLAAHIRDGHGIEAQPEIAFELVKLAANRGDASAIASLGNLYASGRGVQQDKAEAKRLFRQAAVEFPQANMQLIAVLRNTPGTDNSELQQVQARALETAKRYADMGSLYAKMVLATIYANGLGAPVDRGRAVELYRELANQEMVSAMMALGFAYLNGAGVPQDKEQAIGYFKKAAAHGNKDAEVQIARLQSK